MKTTKQFFGDTLVNGINVLALALATALIAVLPKDKSAYWLVKLNLARNDEDQDVQATIDEVPADLTEIVKAQDTKLQAHFTDKDIPLQAQLFRTLAYMVISFAGKAEQLGTPVLTVTLIEVQAIHAAIINLDSNLRQALQFMIGLMPHNTIFTSFLMIQVIDEGVVEVLASTITPATYVADGFQAPTAIAGGTTEELEAAEAATEVSGDLVDPIDAAATESIATDALPVTDKVPAVPAVSAS